MKSITLKTITSFFILALLVEYSCSSKVHNAKVFNSKKSISVVGSDTSLNGLYEGLQYNGVTTDPAYPGKKFKFYHLGYLKLKGDSVYLDQSPIFVYKNDTSFSASDGGFNYYSGTFQKNDTAISINLKGLFCDYCGIPAETDSDGGTKHNIQNTKQLKGRLSNNGFIIDGYLYARIQKKGDLISEHPKPSLKSQ